MAIKLPDGTVLRNLQEQVLKNKQDIETHYQIDRTLADYGIRIIGFYETIEDAIEDLGDPYDGPYGNAIGIGFGDPYTFYIWTRANNLSDVDYWQNVGKLAVVGPQGPQGEQGEPGEAGLPARILTGNNLPTVSGRENDIYMCVGGDANLIGNIYKIVDGVWTLQGNVRGPQGVQGSRGLTGFTGATGPQGPQGPAGDPGGFIKISGIITDLGELPNPTVLQDLEVAFLYGTEAPYELWMQVGPNYEQAIWTNMGALNTATYVSVGGQFQNTWDADTKLDKVSISDGEYHAYVVADDGNQDTMNISSAADPDTIVQRGGNGEVIVQDWPELPNEATSKQYVDGLIVDSETITTSWEGPDLSLNLSADLVATIGKAITIPTSPGSAKTIPVYDRATGLVGWSGTTSFVAAANGPKYNAKGSIWTPQITTGQKYELFGLTEATPSFDITVTKLDNSKSTFTDCLYATITCTYSGWIHVMAYGASSIKAHMYVKNIDSITACRVFALKAISPT